MTALRILADWIGSHAAGHSDLAVERAMPGNEQIKGAA